MSKWEAQSCFSRRVSTVWAQAEIVTEFKQNLFFLSELPVETFETERSFYIASNFSNRWIYIHIVGYGTASEVHEKGCLYFHLQRWNAFSLCASATSSPVQYLYLPL